MPNKTSLQNDLLTPFTAFPCVLVDRVMPILKDTEWRLLCVIVRQTVGWKANGQRHKRRDWMTQRQLVARTGRNSAAISSALNTLVRLRLVDASDEEGKLLLTPQQRRRYNGRIFYGLCYAGIEALKPEPMNAAPNGVKIKELPAKSEVAKSNTTIAREDNKLPDGKHSSILKTETAGVEARRFLQSYRSLFQERTVSGEAPPIIWGRDMKIARDLLKVYSYERLENLLKQFFASHDAWFEKSGYSLPCFRSSIARLLLREGRTMSSSSGLSSRAASGATQPRRYTGWQRATDISQSPTSQSYFLPKTAKVSSSGHNTSLSK